MSKHHERLKLKLESQSFKSVRVRVGGTRVGLVLLELGTWKLRPWAWRLGAADRPTVEHGRRQQIEATDHGSRKWADRGSRSRQIKADHGCRKWADRGSGHWAADRGVADWLWPVCAWVAGWLLCVLYVSWRLESGVTVVWQLACVCECVSCESCDFVFVRES